ncbi:MAG: hypothetical protein HQL08_06265 [Nitrospirae bacterium]|nr:hypothetical protein [Nitrospirota bacterium]
MKWKVSNQRSRLLLIGTMILLAGLGSALLIYISSGNGEDLSLGFEESKMYRHDLELYGGKANVLADEFTRWYSGLWHGKPLAYTVACGSAAVSLGFFFVALHLPVEPESDGSARR